MGKTLQIEKDISVLCVEIFPLPYFSEYVVYQSTNPLSVAI
jgi:hypothetical protein